MKIVDKFQSEIRIPNVCKSNSNSNFKTEVLKFELCLTSLVNPGLISLSYTCLYSPTTEHHRPLAGTHCTYPERDVQAELTWVASYILRWFFTREVELG